MLNGFNLLTDQDFLFWETIHEQQEETNKIVKAILKKMAKETNQSYQLLQKGLREQNFAVTMRFWKLYKQSEWANLNYEYLGYCMGCKKFILWTAEQEQIKGKNPLAEVLTRQRPIGTMPKPFQAILNREVK